ncbi:LamG domain-containing protein [Streptodolium elevatio]|uniref:LamG domain-containing protein n=1 Tax=Streptodolium elevatio TaxID=3157996 RepID=A0ABV3DTZ7_9ACTN
MFEVVDPDRRKKRIGAAVSFGVVAIAATVFGFLFGASGDDDEKSPGADASPPVASGSADPSGGPAASNAVPAPGATPAPTAPAAAPPVAVPADAVAHWELDQGAADTGERFHGTTSGIVTWSPEQSGSAFFAGGGSIQTREPVVDTTRSFTIAAWAKVTETKAHQTIVAQDGTQVSGFYLHYNKDARTWAFVRTSEDAANPAQWYTAAASQPAKIGAWTSLAAVYDASTGQMTLYVDGVAQGSAVAAKSWKAAGPLTIGRATSGVDRLNGSVADVQVFDRTLSAAEVAALAGTQR